MPACTVVPGGIWSGAPMQQTWLSFSNTPCQLTLQPPSWWAIELALGPVTTTLAVFDRGSTLPWLRSRVTDSRVASSAVSRPAVTAAFALLASTHGTLVSLTHGWSNKPVWYLSVRIRRTASLMRGSGIAPDETS